MAGKLLTWTANTEADLAGYKIWRSISAGPLALLTSVGKVTSYTDNALPNVDTTLGYALSAIDTVGNESAKCPIVTTMVNANPPAVPVGLTVADV